MRSTELALHSRVAQWTVQALARLIATFAVIAGVVIIVGGPGRWATSAYRVALAVPGAPETWGFGLIAFGLLTLAGTLLCRRAWAIAGLFLTAIWFFFFGVGFIVAALQNPDAPFNSGLIYVTLAVGSTVLCIAYRTPPRAP